MISVVSSVVKDFFDAPSADMKDFKIDEHRIDEHQIVRTCIEERQWDKFLQLMDAGHVTVDSETNLLHTLCAHRPPNNIVELVLARNPRLVSSRDSLHRTPLHVAIEHGASSGVIRRLLSVDPYSAELKDSQGRTPLIVACHEFGGARFESEEHEKLRVHRLTKAIKLLTQLSPRSSIVIEDDDEVTALEHAISSGAPLAIVKELQKITAKAVMRDDTKGEDDDTPWNSPRGNDDFHERGRGKMAKSGIVQK
eukprot:CAMPEP_0197449262 /NCGR_PEP_ID=MMETSP1175-20131217/20710_1 /TAXON_ID=1003142 /ORGANISM="Triceratium dubium, Strain CCMP147" /LENGTH=251 /DNA_ID=CAMNT_0042981327 /DNA_START=72 /DNA_END=828 /DNA_ORIENTATION=+